MHLIPYADLIINMCYFVLRKFRFDLYGFEKIMPNDASIENIAHALLRQ